MLRDITTGLRIKLIPLDRLLRTSPAEGVEFILARLSGVGARIMCVHVTVVIFYYVHPPL